MMKPINPKWHVIEQDYQGNYVLRSRCWARTLAEAWEKSLAKWATLMEYPELKGETNSSNCGLCDINWWDCDTCPVHSVTGVGCYANTPLNEKLSRKERRELEYLFLLLVREATKNG